MKETDKEKCGRGGERRNPPRSPFTKGGGKMKREEEMQWPSAKAVRMKGIKLRAEC